MRRGWLRIVVTASVIGAVVAAAASGSAAEPVEQPSWTTFGATTSRAGYTPLAVSGLSRAFVLPLSGRITGQILAADGLFIATSTAGDVVAFDRNGAVHWQVDVGQLAHPCQQLDGYGVVATGVIDPSSETLYVADAFGRLHALALQTGTERAGWPIRLFSAFDEQLDWGALTLAGGSVYVPVASYCDTPLTFGGVYAVDVTTRGVTSWGVVPLADGGGGGPWGWGGLAFDPDAQALFAATSGAFEGGSNSGPAYTETFGLGDRLVQLSPGLGVQASSHPPALPDDQDLDFVGSPLLVDTPECGKLVIAATKNDTVYGWRQDDLAAGPLWTIPIEPYAIEDPFVGQLAWSEKTRSVYAVTGTQFVRIAIGTSCDASISWRQPLGTDSENGSPTVAGDTVWFADNGENALVGYDAASGRKVFAAPLAGTTVEAPTVVSGRVVIGTFSGIVDGFSTTAGVAAPPVQPAPRTTRWADSKHGWQSRQDGVYATVNGGRSWRRIYPYPVQAIALVSPTSGVIATGSRPGECMCATRQLWTTDNGATWHDAPGLTRSFATGGGEVYFWAKGTLRELGSLPRSGAKTPSATALATVSDGTIVGAVRVANGVVALISNRVAGQGWDNAPRVILATGGTATTVTLPRQPGYPLVQSIRAAGKAITVSATDFTADPAQTIAWVSDDGGATWSAAPG